MRARIILVMFAVGCSSNPTGEPPPSANEQAWATCGANLHATNGARCNQPNMECDVPVRCDAVNEQVTCTCQGGVFVCSDRLGVIPVGSDAVCTPRSAPDTSPCPPSLAVANDTWCDTVGKTCAYKGPICPESLTQMPSLESCVCRGEANGNKHFVCYPHKCVGL